MRRWFGNDCRKACSPTAVRCLLGLACTSLLAAATMGLDRVESRAGKDWPVFRGNPLQTGIAVSHLPDNLEILWKFNAAANSGPNSDSSFEGTAAIVEGTVYIGSMDQSLYAIELNSGKVKWRYTSDKDKGIKVGPIKTAVSVRDGFVYVGDCDGTFHCVNAATGARVWTYETNAEVTSAASFAGQNVLFGADDETMYCLDRNGKERWKFKVPGGPVLGTPAIVGDRTFAAGCDSSLHVIDTSAGKEIGSPVNLGGQVGASVAVVKDSLYVGTMSNQFLAIDWKKGEIAWSFTAENHPQAFYSSAAVTEKLVVVGSRDKRVHAFERKTGKEIWSYLAHKNVDSSPVIVDRRVTVGSLDGNLYVLDLANGTELQKLKLGSGISASPAVAENRLVIGTQDGFVYCLGAKK